MTHTYKTIIEPFRIKSVEPIRISTREERVQAVVDAGYNLFKVSADNVVIDLLTDSGTGAMSSVQWGGMMVGDESYAGSKSFFRFQSAVTKLTGYTHVIPTHQGRAAERILFHSLLKAGQKVPNNTHFDTTRANIEVENVEAIDMVIAEGKIPALEHPFKGNMDLDALEKLLITDSHKIPLVMVTVTNNSGGGQPVSLENMRGIRALCNRFNVPFFLDACRFAENAYFIKLREPGQEHRTPEDIAHEMFSLADGCTMSAKKDGLANIGGFLAMNDETLAERCRNLLILTEGFVTYGGLAGYDLEAIARGLEEVVEHDYLAYRIRSTQYLGEKLTEAGVPIIRPPGGHAIYIDARAMLPHIPPLQYPGLTLAIALYIEGGIRSCEIGTIMFGLRPDGTEVAAPMDLVRLAIPRRVYTQSHIDYVAEVVINVANDVSKMGGYTIVKQPTALRHFTAQFQPLNINAPLP